jgi:hypothetical protein
MAVALAIFGLFVLLVIAIAGMTKTEADMHISPMPESDGTFQGEQKSQSPCPNCQTTGQHYVKIWESNDGAYEDEKHRCEACGHIWWVDGIDS